MLGCQRPAGGACRGVGELQADLAAPTTGEALSAISGVANRDGFVDLTCERGAF